VVGGFELWAYPKESCAYMALSHAVSEDRIQCPEFRKAVRLDPAFASVRNNMGHFYVVTRNIEAAIAEYQRAVDLAWLEAVSLLSYAHHLSGDDERAAAAFMQAASSPEAATAWKRALDESGYAGMLRATLNHQISHDGRPCTTDPLQAARMLAVIGEPDRMFECLNETV
jgi:hypothetical protein